jgi:hypothetical protein
LGNFLKDNPNALSEFGFDIDIEDKGALKAAVQGFGGGNFKEGAAIITPLMAQYMQGEKQKKVMADAFDNLPADDASGRPMAETASRLIRAGVPPSLIPQYLNAEINARRLATDFGPSASVPQQPVPQTPDEAYAAANLTPDTGKIEFVNGRYVAVPYTKKEQADLGKVEQMREEALKKEDAEKVKEIDAGKAAREEIENTIALIDNAINLASSGGPGGGAGGPIAGSYPVRTLGAMATGLPITGGFFRALGSDYAVRQKSLFDTIRARLTFEKIGQLKNLSQSGSTGLGSISNLEFTALGDSAGQLAVDLPEDMQLKYLQDIKKNLSSLAKRQDKSGSPLNGPEPVIVSRRPL